MCEGCVWCVKGVCGVCRVCVVCAGCVWCVQGVVSVHVHVENSIPKVLSPAVLCSATIVLPFRFRFPFYL